MQRPRTVHLRTESSKDIGNFYTSSAATRPQKKRQRPMTAGVLKGKASEKYITLRPYKIIELSLIINKLLIIYK
jgi:hypothetical protein